MNIGGLKSTLWMMIGLNVFIIIALSLPCRAELGEKWRHINDIKGSGSSLLAIATDGTKVRAIDSRTIYTMSRSGSSLRSLVSFDNLLDISYSDGLWVIVGQSGLILTSTDGDAWVRRDSGVIWELSHVGGSSNGWIILSSGNSDYLFSSNGIDWVSRNVGPNFYPVDIEYANGLWAAVSWDSIKTSSDAINWTTASNTGAYSITWTGSQWMGPTIFSKIISSTDGITWTESPGPVANGHYIASNGTQHAIVGLGYKVHYNDGTNGWQETDSLVYDSLGDVIWTGTHFIAIGEQSSVIASTDGQNWKIKNHIPSKYSLNAVAHGPKGFVAISGSRGFLFSADGVDWILAHGNIEHFTSDVVWAGDRWYAVGTSKVWTSFDGFNWTGSYPPSVGTLKATCYGDQKTVAVGLGGIIKLKDNTHDWTTVASGTGDALSTVAWSGSWFVAGGINGVVVRSNDGINWQSANSGITMNDIEWTGTRFVGVGSQGEIVTSPDGQSWSTLRAADNENLRCVTIDKQGMIVAYGWNFALKEEAGGTWRRISIPTVANDITLKGSIYCMVAGSGTIATSTDGVEWTFRNRPSLVGGKLVGHNGTFVGLYSGTIATSKGGELWTTRDLGVNHPINALYVAQGEFIAVGGGGVFSRSTDGVLWDSVSAPGGEALSAVTQFKDAFIVGTMNAQTALYRPSTGWSYGTISVPWGTANVAQLTANETTALCLTFSGHLLSSDDGINWTLRTTNKTGVFWDGGQFICTSSTGTSTSTDGINWQIQDTTTYPIGEWLGKYNGQYYISSSGSLQYGTPENGWVIVDSISIPQSAAYDGTHIVAGGMITTTENHVRRSFQEWAQMSGISTNSNGFTSDTNQDGIQNGIAFLLNAHTSTTPLTNRVDLLSISQHKNNLSELILRRVYPTPEDVVQTIWHSHTLNSDWAKVAKCDSSGWQGLVPHLTIETTRINNEDYVKFTSESSPLDVKGFFRFGAELINH